MYSLWPALLYGREKTWMSQSLLFFPYQGETLTGSAEKRSLTPFNDLVQSDYPGRDLVLSIKIQEYLDLEYLPSSRTKAS